MLDLYEGEEVDQASVFGRVEAKVFQSAFHMRDGLTHRKYNPITERKSRVFSVFFYMPNISQNSHGTIARVQTDSNCKPHAHQCGVYVA